MRLYLKLFAMVVTAGVIQVTIAGPGEWLDQTQFAIRVYIAGQFGIPPEAPEVLDAADRLRARTATRLLGTTPVPPARTADVMAPEFAAEHVCDEPDDGPRLYARAG
jgi:hypothetical protein